MNRKIIICMSGTIFPTIFRSLIVMCLFAMSTWGVLAQANDSAIPSKEKLPSGIWEVAQITVDKKTQSSIEKGNENRTEHKPGSRSERNVYDKAHKVQSYIVFSQVWEVKASVIVQHYPDGTEEAAEYTLEDNQLKIFTATALQSYQCKIEDDKLTLQIVHNYWNNLPTTQTDQIEEVWTIEFSKKD